MIAFLLILVLVFVAVDLLVRFVVDPMIVASRNKNKAAKSFTPRFDPTFKLATETMYDGGKEHKDEKLNNGTKDETTTKDASENAKQ